MVVAVYGRTWMCSSMCQVGRWPWCEGGPGSRDRSRIRYRRVVRLVGGSKLLSVFPGTRHWKTLEWMLGTVRSVRGDRLGTPNWVRVSHGRSRVVSVG